MTAFVLASERTMFQVTQLVSYPLSQMPVAAVAVA